MTLRGFFMAVPRVGRARPARRTGLTKNRNPLKKLRLIQPERSWITRIKG